MHYSEIDKFCLECGKKLILTCSRHIERKKFCSYSCCGKYTTRTLGLIPPPNKGEKSLDCICKQCNNKISKYAKHGLCIKCFNATEENKSYFEKEKLFCECCGKELINKQKRFCNSTCSNKKLKPNKITVNCACCRKEIITTKSRFEANSSGNMYCSSECRLKFKKEETANKKVTIFCDYCKSEIKRFPSLINDRNYCCKECKNKYHSENLIGEKSTAWKGGKTPIIKLIRGSVKYSDWRKNIFYRDDCQCTECFKKLSLSETHVHHIKELNILVKEFLENGYSPSLEDAMKYEDFWDESNGKTLCKNCHSNYHPGLIRKD